MGANVALCFWAEEQKNKRIIDEKYNKMELNDKHIRKSLYTSDCILFAKEKVCLPAGLAAGDEYKMQREIV